MSIYNGFATRQKETAYLKYLYYMCSLLQDKISSDINQVQYDNQKFSMKFSKLYCKIKEMDEHKYMHPRFSRCFGSLALTLGADTNDVSIEIRGIKVSFNFD